MKKVTLNVQGMSCGHCVKVIEGSVSQLEGVNQVNVKLDESLVEVSFNESQVSIDKIKDAIKDQGYDVE
ncbi:copper chaperone CopZ [Bacillus spizizenii]|uniref:Copper chaperone CopZ n=1 Tax=Bacillus spizizenii (strain DSM 15029 / JCM 12233 / NBRC 101239 / NRRL B-23049 / TU-B-10) TaxID=1052585 RepID=G4NXH7_BACS4|nr:copper chaperone CopZ [Bacillus spizizenii]AEP87496.1 conserved domain protein [Bacillus spizizenii TU-B-10]MCI4168271.1 copper chaperone CopZ [Bacillus spizizenii]MEC1435759.1 copper chaperone CopZ [Bacillus spizizenii]GEK27560.1 copper chaperone CopZ [Bacillus spizizenii]